MVKQKTMSPKDKSRKVLYECMKCNFINRVLKTGVL